MWDPLHSTLRHEAITIETPGYRDPGELTLPKILAMPFGEHRPAWLAPADTATPQPRIGTPEVHRLISRRTELSRGA